MDTKLISIGVMLAMFTLMGFFVGNGCGNARSDDNWKPQVISYKKQIDSMQIVVDTALAKLDREFVKNQRVIIRTKIEYIVKQQEDEKKQYFALDTAGRVEHFRGRVRDITYKQH